MATQAMTTRNEGARIDAEAWIKATIPPPPQPPPRKRWEPKWSAGDRRFLNYLQTHRNRRKDLTPAYALAKRAATSVTKVIAETRGKPFTLDFGRDRHGRRLVFFYTIELRRWLRAAGRA